MGDIDAYTDFEMLKLKVSVIFSRHNGFLATQGRTLTICTKVLAHEAHELSEELSEEMI